MRQVSQSTRNAKRLLCLKYAFAVSRFALLFSNRFYWKGTGKHFFFSLIMLKLVKNASEENHQCFFFFTEQFQEDGYFCKKYFFISIFCLVMASSAVVVDLVSLFNLSACFSLINFLVKFSVVNVSRKD